MIVIEYFKEIADDFEIIEVKDRAAIKSVSSSASVNENGDITLTLVNMDYANEKEVKLSSFGGEIAGQAEITILTSNDPRAHNSFDNPKAVRPAYYSKPIKSGDTVTLPKSSVVSVVIAK